MSKIMIQNARLSFPSLFRRANFNGEDTKFEATLLLDKDAHADKIEEIQKAMAAGIKDNLKGAKLPADKICLRDGDLAEYDGYEGHMSLKASNNKRPMIVDADKSPLTEDDGRPYAGCYVNAIVELWYQNNNYGKRVNANLLGVQFAAHGEPFGAGGSSATLDDFGEVELDEESFI